MGLSREVGAAYIPITYKGIAGPMTRVDVLISCKQFLFKWEIKLDLKELLKS